MKKLLCEMLIIVSLVTVFGFWMLNEWRKRYPITGNLDEMRMSKVARFTHNFSPAKQVKIYKGKWRKTYLEVVGK